MIHDEGDGMGKSGGVSMRMVTGSHSVVMVNRAAFKCRIFQMKDMPAVSSVF